MKKIMFSKIARLTESVVEKMKTNTRRRIPERLLSAADNYVQKVHGTGHDFLDYLLEHSPYKVGEVVAVSQAYQDVISPLDWVNTLIYRDEPGWTNKMYVRAELMPHRIRITNVRVERLQDISDEDCIKEGVEKTVGFKGRVRYTFPDDAWGYDTPREAFSYLLDRISGRGTWASNPWVYAYEFELVS